MEFVTLFLSYISINAQYLSKDLLLIIIFLINPCILNNTYKLSTVTSYLQWMISAYIKLLYSGLIFVLLFNINWSIDIACFDLISCLGDDEIFNSNPLRNNGVCFIFSSINCDPLISSNSIKACDFSFNNNILLIFYKQFVVS